MCLEDQVCQPRDRVSLSIFISGTSRQVFTLIYCYQFNWIGDTCVDISACLVGTEEGFYDASISVLETGYGGVMPLWLF